MLAYILSNCAFVFLYSFVVKQYERPLLTIYTQLSFMNILIFFGRSPFNDITFTRKDVITSFLYTFMFFSGMKIIQYGDINNYISHHGIALLYFIYELSTKLTITNILKIWIIMVVASIGIYSINVSVWSFVWTISYILLLRSRRYVDNKCDYIFKVTSIPLPLLFLLTFLIEDPLVIDEHEYATLVVSSLLFGTLSTISFYFFISNYKSTILATLGYISVFMSIVLNVVINGEEDYFFVKLFAFATTCLLFFFKLSTTTIFST